MVTTVIAAQEVQPGDRIFNRGSSSHDPWVRVLSVKRTETNWMVIKTTDWSTWKHPREGVAVDRV